FSSCSGPRAVQPDEDHYIYTISVRVFPRESCPLYRKLDSLLAGGYERKEKYLGWVESPLGDSCFASIGKGWITENPKTIGIFFTAGGVMKGDNGNSPCTFFISENCYLSTSNYQSPSADGELSWTPVIWAIAQLQKK
ncbi:MAG: hypothetical protein UU24_C0004G0001, partial [Candidatus Nomurabacteria bacterium GW2011_GWA2_40_9]